MDNNNIQHKEIIQQKLRSLEKKLRLSFRGTSNPEKQIELQKYLSILEKLFRKLENNTLIWEDLQKIGISKRSIYELAQLNQSQQYTREFSDFGIISEILKIDFLDDDVYYNSAKINILFSLIDFINTNYQAIFTQKILISVSKTNNLRELFYIQYQEIFHIFHSYKSYVLIPSNSETHIKMIDKEYIQLLKAIYNFLMSITQYIDSIFADDIFTFEDFIQPIKTTDTHSCIYGLTLREALNQCNSFVKEALEYVQYDNKDIFDYISINTKLKG